VHCTLPFFYVALFKGNVLTVASLNFDPGFRQFLMGFGPRGGKATALRLLADADTTRPRAESDTNHVQDSFRLGPIPSVVWRPPRLRLVNIRNRNHGIDILYQFRMQRMWWDARDTTVIKEA
jgi:hypothetical protein